MPAQAFLITAWDDMKRNHVLYGRPAASFILAAAIALLCAKQ